MNICYKIYADDPAELGIELYKLREVKKNYDFIINQMQTHQVDTQNSHNSMLSVVGKRQSELM
jgi:hypothetical protein